MVHMASLYLKKALTYLKHWSSVMNILDFSFIPTAYDRIIYVHSGTLTNTSAYTSVTKTVSTGVGLFIPITVVSLDGVTWYNSTYPPDGIMQNTVVSVKNGSYSISGGKSDTPGTMYYKVLGVEI